MRVTWEQIKSDHGHTVFRAKIFGGWLVLVSNEVSTQVPDGDSFRNEQQWEWRESVTFVPDPKHEWTDEQN